MDDIRNVRKENVGMAGELSVNAADFRPTSSKGNHLLLLAKTVVVVGANAVRAGKRIPQWTQDSAHFDEQPAATGVLGGNSHRPVGVFASDDIA